MNSNRPVFLDRKVCYELAGGPCPHPVGPAVWHCLFCSGGAEGPGDVPVSVVAILLPACVWVMAGILDAQGWAGRSSGWMAVHRKACQHEIDRRLPA